MVGEALFTLGEGRPSPPSAAYMEANRNMTPSKTVRPNVNTLAPDEVRKMDLFDDPVTFVRELSTLSLGVPEFSKFEKNVYRSRYLNVPEGYAQLKTHYNNLMTRYAPRLTALLSQYRADVTLASLNQMSLFSSDHLKSLAVLVLLGSHHNLDMDGFSAYLLNAMRLLYRAVTASKADPVDKSRAFYGFLTKSEGMGRVVVTYMLLLSALEKVLWFSDGEVADDDMFSVFTYMVCCFVEEMLSGDVAVSTDQSMSLLPPMASKVDMLVRHFSVLAFLLKLKVALPNSSVLLSCVRAFRSKLESSGRNRELAVWTNVLNLYLDPDEVSGGSFKLPRFLFDVFKDSNNLAQFTHVVACLEHCFKDPKFCAYVEDNLSIPKFVSLFLFNSWRLIKSYKDDLVNEMLLLANTMLDTLPKTQVSLAKFLAQFPYKEKGEMLMMNTMAHDRDAKLSVWVQKSLETLFNVALLGKSRLQMSAALFLSKLLANADVTRPLPRVNKMNYTNLMLDLVSSKGQSDFTSAYLHKDFNPDNYARDYTRDAYGEYGASYVPGSPAPDPLSEDKFVSDMARLAMMGSFMKYCWNDVASCLLSKLDPKLFDPKRAREKFNEVDRFDAAHKFDNMDRHYNGDNVGDKYGYRDRFDAKFKGDRLQREEPKAKDGKAFDRDVLWAMSHVRAEHLGSSSKETLYSFLSSGTLPAKMLSYEALVGLSPTPDTLLMCALMGLFNRYSTFADYFNKYLALKHSFSGSVAGMFVPVGSLYSGVALKGRDWSNYTMLLLDSVVKHFSQGCDLARQKLFNSLLAPTYSQVDSEKYSRALKSVKEYKTEAQRLKMDYEKLAVDANSRKEEYEHALSKLKSEMSSISERNKNELHKMKEVVTRTNASLQSLEQALNSSKAENSSLKKEVARMHTERESLKSDVASLRTKMSQQQRELDRIPGLVKETEAKSAQNKKLQMELDRKSEELVQCNGNLERLYQMLICLADKYKGNLESHERLKEDVKSLTHQVSHLTSKMAHLESDLKEKERMVSDLNKCKSLSEAELSRLRDEVLRKEEAISAASKRAMEYKEKVDGLSHALQKRTEALSSIEHRYAEVERELAQRRHQLSAIESAFNSRPLVL